MVKIAVSHNGISTEKAQAIDVVSPVMEAKPMQPWRLLGILGEPVEFVPEMLECDFGSGFRVLLVTFTPETCQWILANRHPSNRPLSRPQVNYLAKEMGGENWIVNGETVIFDRHGNARNGQHRFHACIKAAKPFTTLVVFGVDTESYGTMDKNNKRKAADDFAVKGIKFGGTISSVLSMIYLEDRQDLDIFEGHSEKIPFREKLDQLMVCPEVADSCDWSNVKERQDNGRMGDRTAARLMTKRLAAFCHYRFHQSSPDLASEFFDRLEDGADLPKGHPILLLRDRLQANDDDKQLNMTAKYKLAITIKAWNYFVNKDTPKFLKWSNAEDYPTIINVATWVNEEEDA